ncbi:dihydroxyacetone kinase phosphoryl donor subunit DhaM [Geomicrobium sp. JCM 19055]|uniref:dihydroxyacetone kinase phosphoryl donor subunit DhaM n=1 Tax=Geomicrobium sp. JCM 19055 TaxID=1460649 RepID=UPI00045ED35B|nr:dihydroxyacetone kinase phosphoryl donor subunit DhaM [Geomicrobium sp. JCM 19055]GAK00800.1 phosphoenolpyruvate-dihydroxyacetone phosphotransferase [Geomicrobium sp. JCM 19055]
MSSVSILLISHVRELAVGAKRLLQQGNDQVTIITTGGLENDEIGTSIDQMQQALDELPQEDEVLIFYDIGSAKMNAEMLIEMNPDRTISITDAPLIEGGYVAVMMAGLGDNLDTVRQKAENSYHKSR